MLKKRRFWVEVAALAAGVLAESFAALTGLV